MTSTVSAPNEPPDGRLLVGVLNGTVLLAIIGFCLAVGATLFDFVYFLLAWNAMAAWVKIACGVFPRFEYTPFPRLFLVAFTVGVWVSSWIAINPLVMGRFPLVGVVYLYAFTSLPELVRQYHNPESEINSGRAHDT